MVFGLCRPKPEDVLDGDDLQANARSSTPSPPSSPKVGPVHARAASAPASRRGRNPKLNLRRVAPDEPPIAATVTAVVAVHDSGSPNGPLTPPTPTPPRPANGGSQEKVEETRGPLDPLPSQLVNRRLTQKSKPFWELEKGRAPLGKISGRGTLPSPLSEDSPPSMSPAADPLKTSGVGEAHAGVDQKLASSTSEWAVEEFDDGVPSPGRSSPARAAGNGLQRPVQQMPLSELSASAAAQRAPFASLAPPRRLVAPASPASGLASLSELPPLPAQRAPAGGRTALPDPKTLPGVLGSVHGGTRRPAAAPAADPAAAPPAAPPAAAFPSGGASAPAGRSALKGSSGGQGKPAQPGRRLRWVPGEVQRVVVVARPEAVLLAEAKEDYTRNLAAISHLRRQHARAARDKCRLGGADGALPGPPGAAQATQAPGCAAHFGPRPKAPIPRRRSCGFQPAGARHALPGAGARPRPGGGRRGARLAPRTRRLPARARGGGRGGGGRGGGAHVGPDARASHDAAHRASRGGGLLSAARSSSTRDSEGSAMM